MANIPAYMKVRQYVVDLVSNHPDKSARIMSERELCKNFNVARTTVRKALKELLEEGLICAKHGKGMFVNASHIKGVPRLRRSYKVMAIWGRGKHVYIDGFYMDVLARICNQLKSRPVELLTTNLIGESGKTLEELRMYNLDGMLWMRPPEQLSRTIDELRKSVPVCVVGAQPKGDSFAVTADYRKAGRLAASWFLDRKMSKAAFVGHDGSFPVKAEVFQGWADEFSSRGIRFDASLRVDMECDLIARVKELLTDRIDGLFTFGSEFMGVDAAMTETGRKCPFMLDENYTALYGAKHAPAAKLIMFPPAVAELAAESLFRSMDEPGFKRQETVLQPKIEEL